MPPSKRNDELSEARSVITAAFNSTNKKNELAKVSKASNKETSLRKLQRLLSSNRLDLISLVNSGDRKAFRVKTSRTQKTGGVLYSGLTKKLHEVFYPNGGTESDKSYRKMRSVGSTKSLFRGKKAGCGIYGKDHGILVHKQIEDYINIQVMGYQVQSFFEKHEVPDPCFVRFVKTCDRKGWIPMVSELFIYDELMRIATAIDVVCLDTTDFSIVIIDIKNGYESMEYAAVPTDKYFEAPLEFIKDCPLNRHALQLMVTKIILGIDYRVVPEKFRLVRMCPKQGATKVYDMPAWFYDKRIEQMVYNRLLGPKEVLPSVF